VFVYIEDNLVENIALADLAAVVGLGASHFNVLFREAVGLSPHQYLIRRRVERAKDLLGESKLSIGQKAASLTRAVSRATCVECWAWRLYRFAVQCTDVCSPAFRRKSSGPDDSG